MRQDAKKTKSRSTYKTGLKTAMKDVRKSAGSKGVADVLKKAYSAIDKAAKKNVIHKNKANRLKSRISKLASKK